MTVAGVAHDEPRLHEGGQCSAKRLAARVQAPGQVRETAALDAAARLLELASAAPALDTTVATGVDSPERCSIMSNTVPEAPVLRKLGELPARRPAAGGRRHTRMTEYSTAQRAFAEFIGTALLVFIGAGSVPAILLLENGTKAPFSGAH